MNRILPTLPLVVLLFTGVPARAAMNEQNQKILSEAFALYSKGAYSQAVEKAGQIHGEDQETRAQVEFFLGSTEAKMQAFDKATEAFHKAIAAGSKEPSIHYDYGQALFATQQLKEAEGEFRKSIVHKFKMGASAYYIAYIRSVLDDKAGARDFYQRIGKLSSDPDKVKQSSLLQIAELSFEDASALKDDPKKKELRKKMLEGEVQALYRRARDFDPATPIAEQARARLAEIEGQLEELVDRMRNGNPLPRQRWSLLLSQDLTYDSNVITQADQALIQVSNADALISKTGFLAKYQFAWLKTFSFIPELGSSITYHSRRSTPSVYQNDNISISPALRTKYEHWSGGKPATMQLDLDFNLMLRDYLKAHQFPFYTRYYQGALSERVKWFNTGNTTLKAAMKFTEYYDPAKNNYAPTVSLTQLIGIGSKSLVNTVSFDYQHARDDTNDERNYKYRGSMNFAAVIEKIDITPAVSVGVKDTMKQKGTRGNETNLAPNVALTRPFTKQLDGTLEYTWTKNFSKSKDVYQYTKGEVHFGMGYNF
ncbi:MAG: tetratricopeptide repeat protein [Bdellovibrionota bacterium]